MDSVHRGLRGKQLEKDTYGRLYCKACGARLTRRLADSSFGSVRTCPDCEREWLSFT